MAGRWLARSGFPRSCQPFVEESAIFCEQKVAKNFINLGRGGFTGIGPSSKKFLRRFFQKVASSFMGQEMPWPVAAETA
jgi:hypothetical protein